ncbi:hypothetical protein evm_003150 [Chilo suppressalis]|nr:hypothetical protein evm_003150 [Chilo suppressalis]
MDGIGRLGHDPPRGPSADWWVLTTADAAGTNGLTCLPKHGGARDSKFLVTHPMTDHCESTTYSGHYTAYCKHPYTGDWHEYNDSRVTPINPRNVVSSEAYVLFYELARNNS